MAGENDWTPLVASFAAVNWTAVFTGLVSAIAAISAPLLLLRSQSKKEAANVRASLLAEVGALVEVVEKRGFLDALRQKESILRARHGRVMDAFESHPERYCVRLEAQFNRVYQANVAKLGVLSAEEARQIVRFHQLCDSVRLDVIEGGVLAVGTDSYRKFQETIELLEMALVIGRALVAGNAGASCQGEKSAT
jgi:hypothetical protein